MQNNILPAAGSYAKKSRMRRFRKKAVRVLSCAVALCTAYALILPAITLENPISACGLDEHMHSDECYVQQTSVTLPQLTCSYEQLNVHMHDGSCVDEEGQWICGTADYIVHEHESACFDEEGILCCKLRELKEHAHSDACYAAVETHEHCEECYEKVLSCELPEDETHQHDAECYAVSDDTVCGLEETETDAEPELICEKPEIALHTHSDGCYEYYRDEEDNEVAVLICKELEVKAHTHSEECYELVEVPTDALLLTCELEEHAHDSTCFPEPSESAETEESVPETEGTTPVTEESVPETEETTSDTVALELENTTLTAQIYTDETCQTVAQDNMVITVTGELPEGAAVVAYPVTVDAGDEYVLFAYDITIRLADGTVWSPEEGSVTVEFSSPELAEDCEDLNTQAYYLPEDGDPQPVDTTVTEDGLSLTTDHFSVYYATGNARAIMAVGAGNTEANFALDNFYSKMLAAEDGATVTLTGDIVFNRNYVSKWKTEPPGENEVFRLSNDHFQNNSDIPAGLVRSYSTSAQLKAVQPAAPADGIIRYGVTPWYNENANFVAIASQWTVSGGTVTFDGVMVYGKMWGNNISVYEEVTEGEETTGEYRQIPGWTKIGDITTEAELSPYDMYTLVVHRQDSATPRVENVKEPEYIILSYSLYNASGEEVSAGAVQIKGEATLDRAGSVGIYTYSNGEVQSEAVSTTALINGNDSPVFTIDRKLNLDLAGYDITQLEGKTLFEIVPGGELTVQDTVQEQTLSANVVHDNSKTVSYEVMTSTVTDASVGATKEEIKNSTIEYGTATAEAVSQVTSGGKIIAKGSTQPVFSVKGGKLTIDGGTVSGSESAGGANRAIVAENGTVTAEDGTQSTVAPEVTMNGGAISDFNGSGLDGGAIRVEAGTLNLNGGAITGNKSNNGGAVFAQGKDTVINIGSNSGKTLIIGNNEATVNNGGAIYANDIAAVNICQSGTTGNTVAFSGNKTVNYGGAIFANVATKINICGSGSENTVIFANNISKTGAAIASESSAALNIASAAGGENGAESKNNTVIFSGNTVENDGGAIWMNNAASALNIASGAGSTGNKVVFSDNKTENSDATATNTNGGAIYAYDVSSVSICSDGASGNTTVFSGNKASFNGGALWLHGAKIDICSGADTSNNKVVLEGNQAAKGGAVFANPCSEFNISSATGTGNVTAISGNKTTADGAGMFVDVFDSLNICTGASGNTAVISGNTASGNGGGLFTYAAAPAADATTKTGTVNMGPESGVNHDDIIISGNTAYNGGGIFTAGHTNLMMYGGYVTRNTALGTDYLADGGGGMYLANNTVANMFDGYVTGNTATKGGGMRTSRSEYVQLHVNGGFISSNVATKAEGGGICIEEGSYGYILADEKTGKKIYITNNETKTPEHWGGGGVFIAYGAYGLSRQMLITHNDAGGYGGGLAGCSTGRIHLFMEDGAAIYSNTAAGLNMSGDSSAKNFDRLYAHNNAVFNSHGYKDYFCALDTELSGGMLGGNPAFWAGSADGIPVVSNSVNDMLRASYMMGLTANPTEFGKIAAQEEATVFIHGNSSNTHGGGMLINGYLITGYTDEITLGTSLLIKGQKALVDSNGEPVYPRDENNNRIPMLNSKGEPVKDSNDNIVFIEMEHEQFHFTVTDVSTGAVVARGHTEEDGSIFFTEFLSFNEAGVYQYYVKEDKPDDPSITWDTSVYRLTITVEKIMLPMIERLVGFNEITRYQHQITELIVEQYNGSKALEQVAQEEWTLISKSDPPDYDYEPTSVGITNGTTFKNFVRDEKTSVTVVKQWVAKEDTILPESVTVRLYQNGRAMEGEQYTVVLNAGNNWSYTWDQLPTKEGDTAYIYSIVEDHLDNYVPEYTIRNDVLSTGIFVPMNETDDITIGGQYLIVTPDGTNVLCIGAGHSDQAVNAKDLASVTNRSDPYTINGTTYTDYYLRSELNPSSVYTAIGGQQASPVLAAGTVNQSCLLIQNKQDIDDPTVHNHLKDCNNYYYGSRFEYSGKLLIGRKEWYNDSDQYVIVFNGSKFEAINKVAEYDVNPEAYQLAKLYKLVEQPATGHTTIVVTNRLVKDITYTLDVTKVSGLDEDVKLSGAVFQLLDAQGNAISFVRTSATAASYEAVKSGARDTVVTTDLVTDQNGKLVLKGLPAGTYTLVETQAPVGYLLAEPVVISEEELIKDGYTHEIRVVDPPMTYTLPETGGTGTYLYTLGGLMLTTAAAIPLYSKKKRGKEDPASS